MNRQIDDPVFGKMVYDYEWEKTETIVLGGKEWTVLVIAQSRTDDEVEISEKQRESYIFFKDHIDELLDSGINALLSYCSDKLDVPSCTEESFWRNNSPVSIFFSSVETGVWGILFESEYSPEDGIALKYSNQKWDVGPQDILI